MLVYLDDERKKTSSAIDYKLHYGRDSRNDLANILIGLALSIPLGSITNCRRTGY